MMYKHRWMLHHLPYVIIGTIALYLITEPGLHHSASIILYLVFIPAPLFFLISRARKSNETKNE